MPANRLKPTSALCYAMLTDSIRVRQCTKLTPIATTLRLTSEYFTGWLPTFEVRHGIEAWDMANVVNVETCETWNMVRLNLAVDYLYLIR